MELSDYVNKALGNTYRMLKLYELGPKVGLPHVYTDSLDVVEILSLAGTSKSEARRLMKQGALKVEDETGKKMPAPEVLDELWFTPLEQNKVAVILLWIGKRNPLLVIDNTV